MRLATPPQIDEFGPAGLQAPPAGPVIETRIVGEVRSPWFSDSVGQDGSIIASPALFAQYRDNLLGANGSGCVNALVRLHG